MVMPSQHSKTISHRRLNLGLSGDVILTVLVVLGFASVFTLPPGLLTLGDYVVLVVATLAYLLIGIYGWRLWERSRTSCAALAYFAVQISLAAFIFYWSYENAWLLLLPLAGQSIELPRRWTLVVCLLLVVSILLPALISDRLLASGLIQPEDLTLPSYLKATLQLGMALAFVLLFSEMVVRERQARAELDEAYRRLSEHADQVEQLATLRERTRLAREVHDSLGHYLTVLSVQLEIVTRFLDAEPARAREAALKSQELAAEGLAEVRRSVAALRPSPLGGRSLPQAIRHLADETRDTGLAVSFERTGSPCPLSPQVETTLYRAAQEALTNVRKHAQASAVEMRLVYEPDGVRLHVHDDGLGWRAERARDGVGLKGLRERVSALDGALRAESHPDGGFVVEVAIPRALPDPDSGGNASD
jgi:signal transduction histidine kinase